MARDWASRTRGPFLVTEYVLWETMNFASGTGNRAKSHVLMRHVLESPDFEVVPARFDLFEAGLQLHAQRPDKAWSLTDCISFVVMTDRGLSEALTGDHHFEQAGFRARCVRAEEPRRPSHLRLTTRGLPPASEGKSFGQMAVDDV